MAAPADPLRELGEKVVLAASGFLGGGRRDDARALVDELAGRWRGDVVRVSEKTRVGMAGLFHELGLVTRDDLDELELRVAQLEHRLRLLERDSA